MHVGPVEGDFLHFVTQTVSAFLEVMDSGALRVALRIPVEDYIEIVSLMSQKVKQNYSGKASTIPSIDIGMRAISVLNDTLGETRNSAWTAKQNDTIYINLLIWWNLSLAAVLF